MELSKKEAIKAIAECLQRVFDLGLKQSPFDANNSEYFAPLIELNIAPKLYEKLQGKEE